MRAVYFLLKHDFASGRYTVETSREKERNNNSRARPYIYTFYTYIYVRKFGVVLYCSLPAMEYCDAERAYAFRAFDFCFAVYRFRSR